MTHTQKVEAYKALMTTRRVGTFTASPPIWQLIWSLGWEIPPPLFMSLPALFVFTVTTFGVLFGFSAWALGNRGASSMPLSEAGWVALVAGAAFGLAMTWYFRRLARQQALGSWSAFGSARVRT